MQYDENPVERAFERAEDVQDSLSKRWRKHVNRRSLWTVLLLFSLATFGYVFVVQPPDSFPSGELISVPEGQSLREIAHTLKENGVIRNELVFRWSVIILGREKGVYAGDYLFKEPENIFSIARALTLGRYGLEPFKIRIPEGATTRSMARLYAVQLPRFNAESFLAKAQPGLLAGTWCWNMPFQARRWRWGGRVT